MGVMVSFQKQEGKKREINSYRDPKQIKTSWTACILGDRILKGMIWNKAKSRTFSRPYFDTSASFLHH